MHAATFIALTLASLGAWSADDTFRRGVYEIDAHYGMPHLEENLRHARSNERRCLRDPGDLSTIFPVLRDSSMQGCALDRKHASAQAIEYALVCKSSQAPTGTALVQTAAGRVTGVLLVKGGGKNMTYSQRVSATRKGDCVSP